MTGGENLEIEVQRVAPDGGRDGPGRRTTRFQRVALAVTMVATFSAALVAILLHNEVRSPAAELARIRGFVASAGSGRFEGTARSEMGSGADEPGSTSIDISRIEGAFDLPGRLHSIEDSGDYVSETIQLPTGSYSREGESRSEMQAEKWVYQPLVEQTKRQAPAIGASVPGLDEAGRAALAAAGEVLGAYGGSFDLTEILAHMPAVRRVSPGVLEASLKGRDLLPPDVVEAIERLAEEDKRSPADGGGSEGVTVYGDGESPTDFLDEPVTIRLTHSGEGRLDEMVLTTESGQGEDRSVDHATMRFSGWGEPVTIAAPTIDQVDATPGIEEDALAAFHTFPVLAPAPPPPGMVLESAGVSEPDADDDSGGASCPSVGLSYGQPSSDEFFDDESPAPPYLRVHLEQVACRSDEGEYLSLGPEAAGTETVQIGPYQAKLRRAPERVRRQGDSFLTVEFTVGDVVVNANTNLPQEELVAILATVAPLDLASQPIARRDPPPGG